MRRRWLLVVGVMALVAAACSDDGDSSPVSAGDDTSEEADDVADEEPDPEPEPNPLLEVARGVVGAWTGEWNNTTFGSTGAIAGDIVLDEEAMELTINTDLGGNVFGSTDPDPELLTLPLVAGDHSGSSPTFGDWTLTISESGEFSVTATNLPAIPGGTFTMEGALTDAGVTGDYAVDFGDGSAPAVGTITVTKS